MQDDGPDTHEASLDVGQILVRQEHYLRPKAAAVVDGDEVAILLVDDRRAWQQHVLADVHASSPEARDPPLPASVFEASPEPGCQCHDGSEHGATYCARNGRASLLVSCCSSGGTVTFAPDRVIRCDDTHLHVWARPNMPLAPLEQAFVTALRVRPDCQFESLARGTTPEWDSVGHMELILEIEKTFRVSFSEDDVFELADFRTAREILGRHGVKLSA